MIHIVPEKISHVPCSDTVFPGVLFHKMVAPLGWMLPDVCDWLLFDVFHRPDKCLANVVLCFVSPRMQILQTNTTKGMFANEVT